MDFYHTFLLAFLKKLESESKSWSKISFLFQVDVKISPGTHATEDAGIELINLSLYNIFIIFSILFDTVLPVFSGHSK